MGHHRESVLELDALDPDMTAAAVRKAEQAGFPLEPLPDDADESAWRAAYDPRTRATCCWPGADDRVGITAVIDRRKDDVVNTFFTGVARNARGLGLWTRHALLLLDRGERRLYTQNMDQNVAILAANARLGFHVESGFYDYGLAVAAQTQ